MHHELLRACARTSLHSAQVIMMRALWQCLLEVRHTCICTCAETSRSYTCMSWLQAVVGGRHSMPELRQDWACRSCSTSNVFWRLHCTRCQQRNPRPAPLKPVRTGTGDVCWVWADQPCQRQHACGRGGGSGVGRRGRGMGCLWSPARQIPFLFCSLLHASHVLAVRTVLAC